MGESKHRRVHSETDRECEVKEKGDLHLNPVARILL